MADLPPPGWYDDPTSPVLERWWDGAMWSELTRARPVLAPMHRLADLRDVGEFLGHAFGLVRARLGPILVLAMIGGVVVAALALWLMSQLFNGGVDFLDDGVVGWRATQTLQSVFAGFGVLFVFIPIYVGIVRLLWDSAEGESRGWVAAIRFGILNAPRFVGWSLVGALPMAAMIGLIVVLTWGSEEPAGFVFLLFVAPLMWWNLILYFIPAAVVGSAPGSNPVKVAFQIVKGRWWRVFGRIFVYGILLSISLNLLFAILDGVVGDSGFGDRFWPGILIAGAWVTVIAAALIMYYAIFGAATVSIAFDVMDRQTDQTPVEMAL